MDGISSSWEIAHRGEWAQRGKSINQVTDPKFMIRFWADEADIRVPWSLMLYLIIFAQAHEDFRVPELQSIAELHGFPLNIADDFDTSRPFGVLGLEEEEHVRLLARRCILIKYVAARAVTVSLAHLFSFDNL